MAPTRWHAVATAQELAQWACAWVIEAARVAIDERGVFSLVLAGGNTPVATYGLLRRSDADWTRWHLYFGDERCLPPSDGARNSRVARAAWLDHVPLDPGQIHEIPAELGAERAAAAYTQTLRGVANFDLVLLGLGEDGHTASLFPGHDIGAHSDAPDVLAVHAAPKPPPERVSMSAQRLGGARRVVFLVAGAAKRNAVDAWRAGADIPAAAINPVAGVDVLLESALAD